MLRTEQHCRLITNPEDIDKIIKLEASIFKLETFHYNRNILTYPFQHVFNSHIFFESHDFFRDQHKYYCLTSFLKKINVHFFYVSAPHYCGLYPLQVSVNCPYEVYKSAVSYVLDETVFNANQEQIIQPVCHPMSGAGFVIMPHVFVYDETGDWSLVLEDSVTPIAIAGLKESILENFLICFKIFQLLSISELIEARSTQKYLTSIDSNLLKAYQ